MGQRKVFVSGWRPEGEQPEAREENRPARVTYRRCKMCGDLHATHAWPSNHMDFEVNLNRSDLPAPMVIRDGLDDVLHPITQTPYTSKRALRADYRARGMEEIGNEKQKHVEIEPSHKEIAMEVKKATEQLTSMSTDERSNMLRSDAPSALGISVQ